MIANILNINDDTLPTLLLIKLRGQAQTWATRIYKSEGTLTLDVFITQIQEKFSNVEKTHKLLEEFLKINEVNNERDFTELLKKGEFLVEKNCLNTTSCIKLIIARSPLALKPILLQFASVAATWDAFVKDAQNSLWIAFQAPSKEELIIENRNILNLRSSHANKRNTNIHQQNNKKLFCKIHGRCNNNTNRCRIILQLEEQGFGIIKKSTARINQVVEETETKDNQLNKNDFIYSVINYNKTPLTIKIKLDNFFHNGF